MTRRRLRPDLILVLLLFSYLQAQGDTRDRCEAHLPSRLLAWRLFVAARDRFEESREPRPRAGDVPTVAA